jgi:hypothetical protein
MPFLLPNLAPAIVVAQKARLTPVVELRTRFERRLDRDQSSAANDDRSELQTRGRFGFDFELDSKVSGKVRYQYSDSLRWTAKRNDSDMNSDLYLAFAAFKDGKDTWQIGRQPLNFGNKRIFEESNFGQRSKSFDLVRFKTKGFEAFGGKVGFHSSALDQARLAGFLATTPYGETLVWFKHDRSVTKADFWTLDQRKEFDIAPQTTLALEAAGQKGRLNGLTLETWMLHGRLTWKRGGTSAYVEGNMISGGRSATKNRGFDGTYGTPHVAYGLIDVQGARNLNHLEAGVTHQLTPSVSIFGSVNVYALRDARDGWYGTGGSINRWPGGAYIDPTGQSGTDVGTEYNVAAKWQMSKTQTLELEMGIFKPGAFVRAFNGGSTKNQLWMLLSYGIKF